MILDLHRKFWDEQPALLLGLSLLVGTSSPLFWPFPWNWTFPLLWISYLLSLHTLPPIALMVVGTIYSCCLYPSSPVGTTGYFSIASLQPHQSPFQKGFIYKGVLYIDHKKVPCNVHYLGKDPPKANSDYLLKGRLQQRGPYDYLFKPKKWVPIKKTWSLAEVRYQMKDQFRRFLDKKLLRPRVSSFLSSLLTGDVEDRSLRYEFGRLGLQHILAISGFHFAILIAFASSFLNLFLPYRLKLISLLLTINLYFLFIGSVPAIQRSWLTALLYLVGKLISRHSSGLNLLGVALLIEVLLDPLVSANLGFQLSFLSCAGILMLPFPLLPSSSPSSLTLLSQHVYLLSSFFSKALSLTLAVNAAILPLLLYHFHQFPFLSLLYNLFFPFLVSVSLFLLLLALLTHLLFPPLASLLFATTDWSTSILLNLAAYPPIALDYSLKMSHLPAWIIPFYIFVLFCMSITYKNNLAAKNMTMVS